MHAEPLLAAEPSASAPLQAWQDRATAAPYHVPAWVKAFVVEAVRAATPPTYLRWISAGVGAHVRLLNIDDVLFFHADTKYTLVATANAEVFIRKSLRELRCELDPAFWWTIHRSTIVNVRAIHEARRTTGGPLVVSLKANPSVLRVSEAHERQFRQM